MEEVTCSHCGMLCYKTPERRINSRGQYRRRLVNRHDGKDHRCLTGHKDEKDVYIHNSTQRGMPCMDKCGTYVGRDETLPDPKYREVLTKTLGNGQTYFDLEHGQHHTVERCIAIKEYKRMPMTEDQEHVKYIVALDQRNREEGKIFDPETQIWPADLFILSGFKNNRSPYYVRNPAYHDDHGYYIGPKSNVIVNANRLQGQMS
jgi:hypothetical protein